MCDHVSMKIVVMLLTNVRVKIECFFLYVHYFMCKIVYSLHKMSQSLFTILINSPFLVMKKESTQSIQSE